MLRKRWLLLLLAFLGIRPAYAVKLDVSTGTFSLAAETANRSGSISGFGAYSIAYKHPLLQQIELSVGYTVLVSGGISGDLGYGFDVGVDYYPVTRSGAEVFDTGRHKVVMVESWRPYLGVSFHQRQFQAVQIGYAGFGMRAGLEHSLDETISITGQARYLIFGGMSASSATEMDLLLGLSFQF